jgi:hypothetical protein
MMLRFGDGAECVVREFGIAVFRLVTAPDCAIFAAIPLLNRYTATMAVVIGFLAFSIRYIGFGCGGLKTTKSARVIGVVAV